MVEARSWRAPSRTRVLQAGTATASDRRKHRTQAVIGDQTIAVAGSDQPLNNVVTVKFTTGDQLIEPEGSSVECVIARARQHRCQGRGLTIERSKTVAAGRSCGPA